jgi:hypothetical protein
MYELLNSNLLGVAGWEPARDKAHQLLGHRRAPLIVEYERRSEDKTFTRRIKDT